MEKLRTRDSSQQPVLGIKEIPRTGCCEPVESHHCSLQHTHNILATVWQLRKEQAYKKHSCCTILSNVPATVSHKLCWKHDVSVGTHFSVIP